MSQGIGAVAIYNRAKDTLKRVLLGYFPVENEEKVFRLLDVFYGDDSALLHDFSAQKQAKISGKDFSIPIYGKFELEDKTTGKIKKRSKMLIGHLPRLTARGTYILAGTEFLLPMQFRLNPGVYVREHRDGKTKAYFNLRKGRNFYIYLDPKGKVKLEVGSSSISLFPVLIGLGISEAQIEGAWGKEVLASNRSGDSLKEMKKLYKTLLFGAEPPLDSNTVRQQLLDYFKATELDPSNLQVLMGRQEAHVTPQLMLAASEKILSVLRGVVEEDDHDSLKYKHVADLSNFIEERFREPTFSRKIIQTLLRNLSKQTEPGKILSRAIFERPIRSTFTKIDLARTPRQSNPLDMASDQTAITITGEGGIQTSYAIGRSARAVNPSHLGFLDPLHTPEGQNVGTTSHLTVAARKQGANLITRVFSLQQGKEIDLDPVAFSKAFVAFPESIDPTTKKLKAVQRYLTGPTKRSNAGQNFLKSSSCPARQWNTWPRFLNRQI